MLFFRRPEKNLNHPSNFRVKQVPPVRPVGSRLENVDVTSGPDTGRTTSRGQKKMGTDTEQLATLPPERPQKHRDAKFLHGKTDSARDSEPPRIAASSRAASDHTASDHTVPDRAGDASVLSYFRMKFSTALLCVLYIAGTHLLMNITLHLEEQLACRFPSLPSTFAGQLIFSKGVHCINVLDSHTTVVPPSYFATASQSFLPSFPTAESADWWSASSIEPTQMHFPRPTESISSSVQASVREPEFSTEIMLVIPSVHSTPRIPQEVRSSTASADSTLETQDMRSTIEASSTAALEQSRSFDAPYLAETGQVFPSVSNVIDSSSSADSRQQDGSVFSTLSTIEPQSSATDHIPTYHTHPDYGEHPPIAPRVCNLAAAELGAAVSPELTKPDIVDSKGRWFGSTKIRNGPKVVLNGGDDSSKCWSFSGSSGTLGIILTQPTIPARITVKHQYDPDSLLTRADAPRHCILWGMLDGTNQVLKLQRLANNLTQLQTRVPPFSLNRPETFVPLAQFEFNGHSAAVAQSFPVFTETVLWGLDYGIVVLEIRSNWGGPSTSLCQLEVYGPNA